jgi:hypothetical protein
MQLIDHDMPTLFEQLGLPSDDAAIRAFIDAHRPLPEAMMLSEAPFWSDAQATFLRESWREDSDWAPVVDTLNALLHEDTPVAAH